MSVVPAADDRIVDLAVGNLSQRLLSRVSAAAAQELALEPGAAVFVLFKASALRGLKSGGSR